MVGRKGLQVGELRLLGVVSLEADASDLVQEGAVLHLRQPVLLSAGPSVDFVARVGLGDEHPSLRIHCEAVEQRTQGIHRPDQLVGLSVEDEEIAVGNAGVLHDVGDMSEREHIVVCHRVLVGIESHQLPIDLVAPGKLGLVVGLEGDHVEPPVPHLDGAWILRRDLQVAGHLPRRHIDYRDPVLGRERDVGLLVARERNPDRFVEARGLRPLIELLHGGHHLQIGRTCRIDIDHTDRVRNMVGNPEFPAIRSHRHAHRVDSHVDSRPNLAGLRTNHIYGVRGRVHHEDATSMHSDR